MPIALWALFQFVYNTYSSIELYHKKTKIIAIGSIFAAFINFGLNYTFIPIYGYYAAGYTTFFSYALLAVFHLIGYRIVCKKSIFDDRFIWFFTLSTSVISLFIIYLYPYFYLRYLILISLFLVIFFAKNAEILLIFNFLKKKYFKN